MHSCLYEEFEKKKTTKILIFLFSFKKKWTFLSLFALIKQYTYTLTSIAKRIHRYKPVPISG